MTYNFFAEDRKSYKKVSKVNLFIMFFGIYQQVNFLGCILI